MRLILVRHGETEENAGGVFQGHLPGKLSRRGKEQARLLALRLQGEPISAIYTSDLARARDTALAILEHRPRVPLIATEDLRERDLGSWTGKRYAEVAGQDSPDGHETFESIHERARRILDEALGKHRGQTVVFVGHGGINRTILMEITGKSYEETKELLEGFSNTGVCIFNFMNGEEVDLELLDCTKHLKRRGEEG